jgi:tetratricopeptide (TPR) repeat protein
LNTLAWLTAFLSIGFQTAYAQSQEAISLVQQIGTLFDERRYSEATPLAQRLLAIREKELGPNDPEIATLSYWLGSLYQNQNRYAEAEPLFKRALAVREKAFGPDHPDVAESIYDLAILYKYQSRYGEAEPLFKRSLTIYERTLGRDHPSLSKLYSNLAQVYQAQDRQGDAEALYKRTPPSSSYECLSRGTALRWQLISIRSVRHRRFDPTPGIDLIKQQLEGIVGRDGDLQACI